MQLAVREEIELPQEKLIRRLSTVLSDYLDADQIADVHRAYELASAAHEGQLRLTGEPYICHPLSVALILAGMRMDVHGIMAAIMHDVIEDTLISKEELADKFGEEVAELVDGVTKLGRIDSKSRAEAQAQNVRKMFLAMVKDLRVIMVKLADRLHNMQTLDTMASHKRRRIAAETLDIYAPIANRLGMHELRLELEDLGFSAMYPLRARVLDRSVRKARGNRKEIVSGIETTIKKRLADSGLAHCEVIGREKHLYSLYQKMLRKRRPFAEVFDVYAFRIVGEDIDDCYRALGIAHNLYKPIPGRFKDYIAVPKANGYQSLHTVLAGPYGQPLEIQIRTRAMHHLAEAGIAAHWLYKTDQEHSIYSQARAHEWLQDLLEIQKSAGDSMEFLDNLKIDLFQREVYVFTPRGQIIKLPRSATVVDFAYAVHTQVGNNCVSARIDRQLAPLQTVLQNGQTVEIITAPWARPNPLWLSFVVTAKARAAIRNHLRNFKTQEGIALGQRLLEKELDSIGHRYEDIPEQQFDHLLKRLDIATREAMLEDIGFGNRLPMLIARQLVDVSSAAGSETAVMPAPTLAPLIIKGTEGMVVNLAKCCRPIPGDPIIGFFNPGKGVVIHLTECNNVEELRKRQVNWIDVQWDKHAKGEFPALIRLELMNQVGTLAKVASTISRMGGNIENVQIVNQDSQLSVDYITLMVRDRNHLANVMRELRKLSIVLKISRVKSELRKKSQHD
ncbi:MAG: bifunctional (p)ppGpp synthetase/guanosine-3',5'-bis(diphosphate) 3'-pyrophosphohydrolase [Methylococcaceae bacterium]|nr:bifunctional (p)ppGpp synthetase/guanosine-3',5'-bis(diphosphate) 3'-pyrophosphohydrolase [Methylococcaceae bacterium]